MTQHRHLGTILMTFGWWVHANYSFKNTPYHYPFLKNHIGARPCNYHNYPSRLYLSKILKELIVFFKSSSQHFRNQMLPSIVTCPKFQSISHVFG